MDKAELQERMTVFAVRIVKMVDSMPTTVAGHAIARQIIRSGTHLRPTTEQPALLSPTRILSIR